MSPPGKLKTNLLDLLLKENVCIVNGKTETKGTEGIWQVILTFGNKYNLIYCTSKHTFQQTNIHFYIMKWQFSFSVTVIRVLTVIIYMHGARRSVMC